MKDKQFDKRTIQFVTEIIGILHKYGDIDESNVKEVLEFLKKHQESVSGSKGIDKSTNVSGEMIDVLYSLSRDDLIKLLDDKTKFPNKSNLIELSRTLHISNVSKLSGEKIKQKIVQVVFDKPEELRRMRT